MEWRKYIHFNRTFEVSDTGKVRNETGKIVKGSLHAGGFRVINTKFYVNEEQYSKSFLIHRMVAKCWVDNPELKPYVIHLNGDLLDNRPKNLAWATADEKNIHQKRKGKVSPRYKLTQVDVIKIKKLLAEEKVTVESIAKKFGVSHTQIHRIKRNENWQNTISLLSA
jgi:hypothetical protein